MRLSGALLLLALAAGCTNFKDTIHDRTELAGPGRGDLGRELEVSVAGAKDPLPDEIVEAVAADLENGDLFDEVHAASGTAPVASGASTARLDIAVQSESAEVVHDFWRQRDGFVARYELTCALIDRTGQTVVSGPVSGIGYDDVTDPDHLTETKKGEIRAAARRDAALKVGRFLRRAAEAKADEALKAIEKVHLPPGVGPVRVATIGFDDDPAARRRRGSQLTRALAGALQKLGPDFEIVSPEEVEQELGADPTSRPSSYEKLKTGELDRMVPRLGMRLYVVGKVSADGNRIEATAWIKGVQNVLVNGAPVEPPAIGTATGAAEGPGALSLVAVALAKQLGAAVKANPPAVLPKKDEND